MPLSERRLRAARAAVAAGQAAATSAEQLGGIVLRPHQREAAVRMRRRLDEHHGCLLAEPVGRGKTFVALAVAGRWSAPLVVLPAVLRDTWRTAMQRTGVDHAMLTHESLSRGGRPAFEPDGVIVDESHHFRNPGTRRYGALAELCMRSDLLLLSATPVQNGVRDLRAQLALFLGTSALQLDDASLAEHVVRVEDRRDDGLPALASPRWVQWGMDDTDVLRAILDLPSPPRAFDAGDAGALRTMGLVRAWASSRAALQSALGRRRRAMTAIEQSLEVGRVPSRAELGAWQGVGDEGIQLGFAALLSSGASGDAVSMIHGDIEREREALDRLGALLRRHRDVDAVRASGVQAIVQAHPRERVIAFTELASTARACYSLLRHHPQVALLTASDARIASGRITRREVLDRFAPVARGSPEPPLRERIGLLISTDLLSEGVNLQDANVVIHLDLPWNPARLAQRVGRLRRPSASTEVHAYLMAPPADTEVLIEIEARLRRKLAEVERTVGRGLAVIPSLTMHGIARESSTAAGLVERAARMRAKLDAWRDDAVVARPSCGPLIGAVDSAESGWLAMLSSGRLVGALNGGAPSDDLLLLDRLTQRAEGVGRPPGQGELATAASALDRFLAAEGLLADCGAVAMRPSIAGTVERFAVGLLRRCDRHARSAGLRQLGELRRALDGALSAGMERALHRLMADAAARTFSEFTAAACAIVLRPRRPAHFSAAERVEVMILLGPSSVSS